MDLASLLLQPLPGALGLANDHSLQVRPFILIQLITKLRRVISVAVLSAYATLWSPI
jgi:hypothetical protein